MYERDNKKANAFFGYLLQLLVSIYREQYGVYRANDAASEAICRYYQKGFAMNDQDATAYLVVMTRNILITNCKNENKYYYIDTNMEYLICESEDPEEMFMAACIEANLLNEWIGILSPCEQKVIQAFRDGMTYKETESKFGMSYNTAKSHKSKALTKLRLHLSGISASTFFSK